MCPIYGAVALWKFKFGCYEYTLFSTISKVLYNFLVYCNFKILGILSYN